jgi:hypothetical protein
MLGPLAPSSRLLGAAPATWLLGAALAASALAAEPTPRPVYGYVVVPARAHSAQPGDPQILRIEINKQHFRSHDVIQMEILTSDNVVRVTTREMGHEGTLRQLGPGRFLCHGRIPGLPSFLQGMRIDLRYTATTASGNATSASAFVTL